MGGARFRLGDVAFSGSIETMRFACLLAAPLILAAAPEAPAPTPITPDDLALVAEISDPVFTADNQRIVYALTTSNSEDDKQVSDLWIVPWDGRAPTNLTRTPKHSEWQPAVSSDARRIAFLSDAGEDEDTQLWTIPPRGGSARQVTHIVGGISDYSLSPDGRFAIVVAEVGGGVGADKDKTPPPIVIDRFVFREDGRGRIDGRRRHLFRVDMANGQATQISSGDFDHWLPAISPDGRWVAYVAKRDADADRHANSDIFVLPTEGMTEPRKLSSFEGADQDPQWEAGRPAWSPDSTRLLWLRGGDDRWIYYAPHKPVIGTLATGAIAAVPTPDRWTFQPRFAEDGQGVLGLDEGDRETRLVEVGPDGVPLQLTPEKRFVTGFAVGSEGRVAVVEARDDRPTVLRRLDGTPLVDPNPWLGRRRVAPLQEIAFTSDGVEIHGLLMLPPDHRPGERHPLVVRLHGGPVYQFSHEYMDDWQAYAAHGYAVLGVNPRGSSGRGFDFARAIYADWGRRDVADIRAGIDHVVALAVADPARIGVGGWSYGGILTNYMIASDPRIRAAVSGAGMANFLGGYGADQYALEYEAELGTPWANFDTWTRISYPFLHADRITAPTLYLCAGDDMNVPCIGAEQMYQALKSRGLPTRLVVYPGENHGLTVPSYRIDRIRRSIAWYDRFLRGAN